MKQQIYALIALSLLTFCTCKNCIDSKTSKNFNFDISLISKDENNLGKAEIIVKIKWTSLSGFTYQDILAIAPRPLDCRIATKQQNSY